MTTYKRPNYSIDTYDERTDETQIHTVDPVGEGDAERSASDSRELRRLGRLSWGAGFFGWLVSVAIFVLLSALVAVGVGALGTTGEVLPTSAAGQTRTVGIAAAAIMFGLLLISYYTGGYVAGRMSRFAGGKQGVGVWIIGLLATGAAVGAVLLLRPELDASLPMDLPALALPPGTPPIRGVITAVAALVSSLLAAMAGGKVGCGYHRKVDEATYA